MSTFSTLAPVVGWLGAGGAGVIVALAVAWFFPPFRRIALEVAAVLAIATTLYGKGISDGSAYIQAKWDAQELQITERNAKARSDAERTVRDNPDGVRNDPNDRDK